MYQKSNPPLVMKISYFLYRKAVIGFKALKKWKTIATINLNKRDAFEEQVYGNFSLINSTVEISLIYNRHFPPQYQYLKKM